MNLETKRLQIRKIMESDAETILDAVKCPEVHFMYGNQFDSIEKVQQFIQVLYEEYDAGKYRTMAIADKTNDLLIGTITLEKDKTFPRAEVSYWISNSYRNAGYATEAVTEVIAYGFNSMSLNRIQAMHFPNNLASGRVLEKAGMQYEGTLRQYVGMGEIHLDCMMYSIVRNDFIKLRD